MSESCNHKCESCSKNCSDRTKESLLAALHEGSKVKKVIGVVSGKGGVGKSMVTSQLAVLANKKGFSTAILDADITGPSIPKAFGLKDTAMGTSEGLYPVKTEGGISVMSLNLMVKNETDPVVWRGPIIGNMVKQFWSEVIWGDVDYMFIDMPPGTGDVALTVFQSIPVDGIIIVVSPQELVGMIAEKAVNMAAMMDIPILGIVENMSWLACPDCGKKINVFGESKVDAIAERHGIQLVAKLPIDTELASICDNGRMEDFEGDWLAPMLEELVN